MVFPQDVPIVVLILNDLFFSALGFAAGLSFWQFRTSRKGKR